jgi:hypothetical protein
VDYDYPLEDVSLPLVAQFLAVSRRDGMLPKEALVHELREVRTPDLSRSDDAHRGLASLSLPIYVTMNYDDLMFQALELQGNDARREILPWNADLARGPEPDILTAELDFDPMPTRPVVVHLYGHISIPESIVLTEDDFIDFLVFTSKSDRPFPHQVLRALASSSLLFIGADVTDWRFRMLYRGVLGTLPANLRRLNVAIQLPSKYPAASKYLAEYLAGENISVYWGSPTEFVSELDQRLRQHMNDGRI